MEWFHFSDFHLGRPRGPQKEALAGLIDAVEMASRQGSGKVDAVFITGDMAYSGKAEEYCHFRDDFLLPLRALPAFAKARVFSVPGNHDVDCDAALPIVWQGIGKRNQDVFFCENEEGVKTRSGRATVFNAYREFVTTNDIISPDPLREVSLLHRFDECKISIIATNTAFFCDRDASSGPESIPSPITSLRAILEKESRLTPCIVLAHHPISCLCAIHQRPFTAFLRDRNAVLLHGHEHRMDANFNVDGVLQDLGFGATYIASLQDQGAVPYQNSFAHCCLDSLLAIRSFSWQPTEGRWMNTTAIQLSHCLPQGNATTDLVQVRFPQTSSMALGTPLSVPVSSVRRAAPQPTRVIPVGRLGQNLTRRLFLVSKNLRNLCQKADVSIQVNDDGDGKLRCEMELTGGERHLVIITIAPSHILSSKEVESINTELDSEGYASATMISLGVTSAEAQAMYLRLQSRKPLEVLTNEDLTAQADLLLSGSQQAILSQLDAARNAIYLLLSETDLYLLVMEQEKSSRKFYVVGSTGARLSAVDPIVTALRRGTPEFSALTYEGEQEKTTVQNESVFCENEYLASCYREYNVMKYAALASVGIRFSEITLEELYIDASASEINDEAEHRAQQLIDDHLASYSISDELKSHIQKQLLASVHGGDRNKASYAREFCQKYSAVLITGDPGSGKTCFIKNEILAYCRRALSDPISDVKPEIHWHSRHIPVMVSLSEAVAEDDLEAKGLLNVASRLLERRGFLIAPDQMRRLALEGRLALFFDGVDEVVSVEKRALVVRLINELIAESLSSGNRIMVTSRPAAVQVVNLLPSLHRLELQGLSSSEIRTLARRVLTLRLSGTQDGVGLQESRPNESQNVLIDRLVSDCEKNPGISRLAQNPLLLTLLIIIYANSGAPSAKRHLIYEEAVRTLASVRGYEAGHKRVSLQDLRERLGAVALSVYNNESGLLPTRAEVRSIVRKVMSRQTHNDVSEEDANDFIQRVAESTGLITIEPRRGEEEGNAIVSFMHHSFLEYFAAIGMSKSLNSIDIGKLVREPRWHEILTLLAGVIGESEDIAPIIEKILTEDPLEPDYDAKALLFAVDCALECDIPSEAAQRLLINSIRKCLVEGVARLDPWVRSEIGQRLQLLLNVCENSYFDLIVGGLIQDEDEYVSAAALDVAGYSCASGYGSAAITRALEVACKSSNESVLTAICQATSRAETLRSSAALEVVVGCLNKSQRCRKAAYEALAAMPEQASAHWSDIINGIDDTNAQTSRWASIAAVQAGLNADLISLSGHRKDVLLRAINQIDRAGSGSDFRRLHVSKATLTRLLSSQVSRDRTLGICLLPFATAEERYIYDTLIEMIRSPSNREDTVAAMFALRWSRNVLPLVTIGDVRTVISLLNAGTSDVRVGATELLGNFGFVLPAVEALLNQDLEKLEIDEYCASILSLSKARIQKDRVAATIASELNERLAPSKKMNSDNVKRIGVLLDASRRLKEALSQKLVTTIRGLVDNYRIDDAIRKKALLCFPAIAMPSKALVMSVAELYSHPPAGMETELVQLPATLASKCRENVDFVIASVTSLHELRGQLLQFHSGLIKRRGGEDAEYLVSELRNGIDEINQIIVAFRDFIGQQAENHIVLSI